MANKLTRLMPRTKDEDGCGVYGHEREIEREREVFAAAAAADPPKPVRCYTTELSVCLPAR